MDKDHKFSWPAVLYETDSLASDFLADPKRFAERLGIQLADLSCPEEVHAAWKRGEAFAYEAQSVGIEPTEESIERLRDIAIRHFGPDFEADFIPFGLRFRERIEASDNLDWTATVSGKITWLDGGPDVDG